MKLSDAIAAIERGEVGEAMTIPAHLLEKTYAACSESVEKTDWTRSAYNAGFLAGASFGYQLAVDEMKDEFRNSNKFSQDQEDKIDEQKKLLDEVEYLLCGIRQEGKSWSFEAGEMIEKLKAHRGINELP